MKTSTIPAEAIDAAMKAIESHMNGPIRLHDLARAALEAAAPHMRAAAWEEGMQAMYDTTSSEWPPIPERNPYRPTA